jgi:hypothetical protein
VLGVPNYMTYADFCQFCASFIHHILEMRIVRFEFGSANLCCVLLFYLVMLIEFHLRVVVYFFEVSEMMEWRTGTVF